MNSSIEPFYCKTISPSSTHSSLKEFYRGLYSDMGKTQDVEFFMFAGPRMESVNTELYEGVVASYGAPVITAIKDTAAEHEEDVVKLVCEFLENRAMTISQISLERESGVINGDLSDDIVFLRNIFS